MSSPLVSTDWLQSHLSDSDLRIVDASWHMPDSPRDADAEYASSHIPGAVRFHLDLIADTTNPLPHMLASPDDFAKAVGALGISQTDTIIIYDGEGLFSAARVWWNFKIMGAKKVFVLDGGLPKWVAESRPVSSDTVSPAPAVFTPEFDPNGVADAQKVLGALDDPQIQVVDVRAAARFAGQAPEPRAGIRSGHMPGALNCPCSGLSKDGCLLDTPALLSLFSNAGLEAGKPVIASCGSGVTAAILVLALYATDYAPGIVYDGSWTEWGGRHDLPIVTGA